MDLGTKTVRGKKLKYGITTGTCAAAAAKAACYMLATKNNINEIEVELNNAMTIKLPVEKIYRSKSTVKCAIKKFSGDDPDVTDGLYVFAEVKFLFEGIKISSGEGIGIVTKRGLPIHPGNPAINPGPLKMIEREVKKVMPNNMGVEIILSIPGGEKVAEKTFNPRLGIKGGLSILGSTGLLEPMSNAAIVKTIKLEINQKIEEGIKNLILVPGNFGTEFVEKNLSVKNIPVIKISNFIGEILEYVEGKPLKNLLLVGHIGKLIKVAGGIFNTHSSVADGRMEILAALAASEGLPSEYVDNILHVNTTSSALKIIESIFNDSAREKLYSRISDRIRSKILKHIHDAFNVGVILFDLERGLLSMSSNCLSLLEEFNEK